MAITRSENMRRITARDTRPEIALHEALLTAGLKPDKHATTPVGRPDFVFGNSSVAVFVHGCQWHGCPDHYARPRTRSEFWALKLAGNVERDRRQAEALAAAGWKVVLVWEHEVVLDRTAAANRVRAALEGNDDIAPDWRVVKVEVVDEEARIERRFLVDTRNPDSRREITGRRVTAKARAPSSRRASAP